MILVLFSPERRDETKISIRGEGFDRVCERSGITHPFPTYLSFSVLDRLDIMALG